MPYTFLLFTLFVLTASTPSSDRASNRWTRFRGADGQGIHTGGRAPASWKETDFLWNIELPGTGHASPVIWGARIFVTSSDDKSDRGYVMAVDEHQGKLLWKHELEVTDLGMHRDNNLAAPSPAVDELHVYTVWYSKERTKLLAFSHEGALSWQAEFGGIEARHGGGSSITLTDQYVIFTREQETGSPFSSSWLAVDKRTGETAWELERESAENNSFSTPILISPNDSTGLLLFTSQAHGFTAVDPETGAILWERKTLLNHRVVASPVYAGGRIVACRKGEAVVLEVDADFNPLADTARYTLPANLSPYVPTPIVVDELLFLFLDNGSVACLELSSGKVLWKERPAGPIYGSPICVDGKLYCITRDGRVIVLRARADYELLGISALGEESFSTPAMTGSGLVFRTFTRLMLLGS